MKIFLVRHGESISNTDENCRLKIANEKVYLTQKGIEQAKNAGRWLKEHFDCHLNEQDVPILWVSTFERARQTAKIINAELKISDIRESEALTEQGIGMCSGMSYEEVRERFLEETLKFEYAQKNGGLYYVTFPTGESPEDVGKRIKRFICENRLRANQPGVYVIVSHAVAIRCFTKVWFGYSDEWYDTAEKMGNCWIRYIEDNTDHGFIFRQ